MMLLRFAAPVLATSLLLVPWSQAHFLRRGSLYPVLASDSKYESNCPSDADHMNGCIHFNITADPRSDPQLISELAYDTGDTILVDPRYIGQTMPTNTGCAVLNHIHSRTYLSQRLCVPVGEITDARCA